VAWVSKPSASLPALHVLSGDGVKVTRGRVSNGLVDVRISAVGVIDVTDRESGEHYPALLALEDETDVGDTYTFSRGPGRAIRGGRPVSQSVLATGPLIGAVETRWELAAATGGTILVRQVVVLHRDSSLVRSASTSRTRPMTIAFAPVSRWTQATTPSPAPHSGSSVAHRSRPRLRRD
jgi:hypothetical protein